MKFVFYPGGRKLFMHIYNKMVQKVIVFKKFKVDFYPPAMLKRLLEGREYAYPVECVSVYSFCLKV